MLNWNTCFFLILLYCSHLGGIDGYIADQMFQLVNNRIAEKTSELPIPIPWTPTMELTALSIIGSVPEATWNSTEWTLCVLVAITYISDYCDTDTQRKHFTCFLCQKVCKKALPEKLKYCTMHTSYKMLKNSAVFLTLVWCKHFLSAHVGERKRRKEG